MNVRQLVFLLIASAGLLTVGNLADAQQVQIKGPKNSNTELSGSTYGPITPEDTLWRIANRYRQNKNLSVYQVMQAIYQLNPNAFDDQNFNHLKDGAVLNLPAERYVARIDPQQARVRAERDDSNWQANTSADGQPVAAATPQVAASKDDLTQTKQVIEDKLSALDAEQNRQFMAIRQQFAQSIESVQTLLTENQKLAERLNVVDQEITSLRGRVDEELQVQMDQMLALQNELLSISREAEAERQAEKQSDNFAWLTDPIFLIFLTVLLTISVLGAFAMWLIRRSKSSSDSLSGELNEGNAAILEQSDEMDDLADALTNELHDDLDDDNDDDLFADDDLLDDVLSDELEESLDSAIDDEFEEFDDLDDESLDPVIEEAADSLEDDGLLDQDDLDNLFDEDEDELLANIDEGLEDLDSIATDDFEQAGGAEADSELDSLLEDDVSELLDEEQQSDSDFELSEAELDASLESDQQAVDELSEADSEPVSQDSQAQPEAAADDADEPESSAPKPIVDDEQEKPEISIDELLEQPAQALPESVIPENADLMNEEMLHNIDKEIESQNQQLDAITDELLNEIEQLEHMGGMLDEPADEEQSEQPQPAADQPSQMGIQALDELSEQVDDDDASAATDTQAADQQRAADAPAEADDAPAKQELQAEPEPEAETAIESQSAAKEQPEADPIPAAEDVPETDANLQAEAEPEPEAEIDDIDALLADNQPTTDALKETDNQLDEDADASDDADAQAQEHAENDAQTHQSADIDTASADELLAELEQQEPSSEPSDSADSSTEQAADPSPDDSPAGQGDLASGQQPADETQDGETQDDEMQTEQSETTAPEVDPAAELEKALDDFEQEVLSEATDFDIADNAELAADESHGEADLPAQESAEVAEIEQQLDEEIPSIDDLDSLAQQDDDFDDSDLDEALKAFDENLIDPELSEDVDNQPSSADENVELDDLPGLGDWLSSSEAEESNSLDDLEKTSFDDLLDSIDSDEEPVDTENEDVLAETGLDFNALLNETDEDEGKSQASTDSEQPAEQDDQREFLDVDDLINQSIDADDGLELDKELDLAAALESYQGLDKISNVDVDSDKGIGAKLDLAQAYIETDDTESARELLQEVLKNGDESQQQEAQELLDSLPS